MKKSPAAEKTDQIIKKYKNDFPKQRRELKKLLKQATESGDLYLIGAVYDSLARVNYRDGMRNNILPYAFKAVTLLKDCDDHALFSRAQNMLGIAYNGQGDHRLALQAFQNAFNTVSKYRSCPLSKESIKNNMAVSYYQLGDIKTGIKITENNFNHLLKTAPKDHITIATCCLNLSTYYDQAKDHKKARYYAEYVIKLSEDAVGKRHMICAYSRLSCIEFGMGNTEAGIQNADTALSLFYEYGEDDYEMNRDFERIASWEIKASEYERAYRFIRILIDYSKESGHTLDRILEERSLAAYYSAKGELQAAIDHYSELDMLYRARKQEEKEMDLQTQRVIEKSEKETKRLIKLVNKSRALAETESLTRLLNRGGMQKISEDFIKTATDNNEKVGAIFIDIDYFKECNDTYGHSKGDEVLLTVAASCRKEEKSNVRFARYGGDEFFGIMHGLSDDQVTEIAMNISRAVREANIPHKLNPNGRRVTISLGVVNFCVTDGLNTPEDFSKLSDMALYMSKESGRDKIYMLDPDISPDALHKEQAADHIDPAYYIEIENSR
ncbi:MAG: GGDEF domain-containing protein [Lachnospiraceae bacterium]|nr:GGDEF domain-containing protein [Lachnospiraceae bacterium]